MTLWGMSWKDWHRAVIFALHFLVALVSLGVQFWPKCRVTRDSLRESRVV